MDDLLVGVPEALCGEIRSVGSAARVPAWERPHACGLVTLQEVINRLGLHRMAPPPRRFQGEQCGLDLIRPDEEVHDACSFG